MEAQDAVIALVKGLPATVLHPDLPAIPFQDWLFGTLVPNLEIQRSDPRRVVHDLLRGAPPRSAVPWPRSLRRNRGANHRFEAPSHGRRKCGDPAISYGSGFEISAHLPRGDAIVSVTVMPSNQTRMREINPDDNDTTVVVGLDLVPGPPPAKTR
jgi:hypothetical protein